MDPSTESKRNGDVPASTETTGTDPHTVSIDYTPYLPSEDSQIESFLMKSYGGELEYEALMGRLIAISPNAVRLISDPGVIQNLKSLEGYLEEHPEDRELDAAGLRTALSRRLGTQTVFRGIKFSEAQFEQVQTSGMLLPRKSITSSEFEINKQGDFQQICINHTLGPGVSLASGCVLSVSSSAKAAIGLANPFPLPPLAYKDEPMLVQHFSSLHREANYKGESFYLLELEVPKVALINFQKAPFDWHRYESSLKGQVDLESRPEEIQQLYATITEPYGRPPQDFCAYGPNSLLQLRTSDGSKELVPMISPNGDLAEHFVFGGLALAASKARFTVLEPSDPRLRWTAPLPWVTKEELSHLGKELS